MVDQIVGLLLLGLGINTQPVVNPNVLGEDTVVSTTVNRPVRALKDDLRNLRDTRKASAEAIREHRKDFLESLKDRREAAKKEYESRRETLKDKLEDMKDEQKAAHIERINEKCQKINEKRTERMSQMLEKLSKILENVINRASAAEANGKDISSVDTAVAAAQTAITDAQAAVETQAGVECVITINTETTAKNDVGAAISGMQQSLRAVYDKVIAARKAVGAAIKALGAVLGESLTPTPTPTP